MYLSNYIDKLNITSYNYVVSIKNILIVVNGNEVHFESSKRTSLRYLIVHLHFGLYINR